MNRKIFMTISAIFLISAILATPALASKPVEVTGSFTVDISAITTTPIIGPVGTVPITVNQLTGEDCFTFTGDISGSASYSARWVYHAGFSDPDSFITHTGYYIFEDATVSVDDVTATGGLILKAAGNGQHEAGIWRVISSDLVIQGTEEPIRLQGQGEFLVTEVLGAYDIVGQLHFDP